MIYTLCLLFPISASDEVTRSEQLESLQWDPNNSLADKEVEQFLVIARLSIGLNIFCDNYLWYIRYRLHMLLV